MECRNHARRKTQAVLVRPTLEDGVKIFGQEGPKARGSYKEWDLRLEVTIANDTGEES